MDFICLQNLYKNFGHLEVLKNINLTIKKGTIFGLVGHSGAGKSTLLRTFNGLESIDRGSIFIDGLEISRLNMRELRTLRQSVGMIFQHFSLLERKNVYENIILPMQCARVPIKPQEIKSLLELVGLIDKEKAYPNELSGGQKQRVAIARALAMKPKLLLSDEATSALDPNITGAILDLLKNINQELNVTIVLVTHEMEVVKRLCKEAAFMENGAILKSGTIEELFLTPNQKMREFLGENEILPESGLNIRIYFPENIAQNPIITQMARELQIDFNIVWGNVESFNGIALGVLVINIQKSDEKRVLNYLHTKGARWEIISQKAQNGF